MTSNRHADAGRPPVVVLQSMRRGRAGTTYVDHMVDGAAPEVTVRLFSWTTALLGQYDVVHLHWPEHMIRRRHPVKGALAAIGLVALLLRARRSRVPVVRTVHNLAPHQRVGPVLTALLAWADRRTDAYIHLNAVTPARAGVRAVVIPHGHYRDRFAHHPQGDATSGRLLHIGLIEPYKGLEVLLRCMHQSARRDLSLRVVGLPKNDRARTMVRDACAEDDRISSRLEFVSDAELVREVTQAALVALPYRHMHNSGMVLVALSLNRPVLVPRTPANEAIADEVGPGWVLMYDGAFDVEALESGLREAGGRRGGTPRLEGRDWATVGEQHYQLYLEALRGRRGTSAQPRTRTPTRERVT